MNKYQLIHIDTNEVTMCEKITIEGEDYYVYNGIIYVRDWYILNNRFIFNCNKNYEIQKDTDDSYVKIIATTNTSLKCPQVIDYLQYLGNKHADIEWGKYYNDSLDKNNCKDDFIKGIELYSETHSFSDEEVIEFVKWQYKESFNKGTSSYSVDELLQQFKTTLPTKLYYR